MAHTYTLNLPIHCQFLAAPVRWEVVESPSTGLNFGPRLERHARAKTIDPWHARAEFLRLPLDPEHPRFHRAPEELIEFLNRVGVWEQPPYEEIFDMQKKVYEVAVLDSGHVVHGQPTRDLSYFWEHQMLLGNG